MAWRDEERISFVKAVSFEVIETLESPSGWLDCLLGLGRYPCDY